MKPRSTATKALLARPRDLDKIGSRLVAARRTLNAMTFSRIGLEGSLVDFDPGAVADPCRAPSPAVYSVEAVE